MKWLKFRGKRAPERPDPLEVQQAREEVEDQRHRLGQIERELDAVSGGTQQPRPPILIYPFVERRRQSHG